MRYLFPPAPPSCLPLVGSDEVFPIHRIYCVGRNYAAHAREMGSDPTREAPFFFCKPADAAIPVTSPDPSQLPYPALTANFHHEVELVVAIGQAGRDIRQTQALDHVCAYAIGLDMTRRDIQFALRDKGRPWEPGKAFDQSAPIGPLHPVTRIGHPQRGAIWLNVNGQARQRGDLADMIWPVADVISQLSGYFVLQPGDLIFTGTPEGVGPVVRGDRIDAGIESLGQIELTII